MPGSGRHPARVTGFLEKMPFREGAEVKKGDPLFEIDRRPYQAQHDQAQGQVTARQAQLKLTSRRWRAISRSTAHLPAPSAAANSTRTRLSVDEAEARVRANQASMEVHKLNLGYTKVTSPIDGQVSRYYFTAGNLVVQDQTLLTTVVSLDPMYAYFDMDEPTRLRIDRAINAGKITPPTDGKVPIFMGCKAKTAFRTRGRSISSTTSSIQPRAASSVRGVFPNPSRRRACGCSGPACLCASTCRSTARTRPCWSSIGPSLRTRDSVRLRPDADNKLQYRRVATGALQNDGQR